MQYKNKKFLETFISNTTLLKAKANEKEGGGVY